MDDSRILKGYHFLAQPYTDKDPKVMEERYEFVLKFLHVYHKPEYRLYFSPIVMCHNVAVRYDLPRDFEYWKLHNRIFMDSAIGMEVLCIDGWDKSVGVRGELEYMITKGKPIILSYFTDNHDPVPATKIEYNARKFETVQEYMNKIYSRVHLE